MQKLRVIDHPILKRDLTILRKADTPYGLFRETIRAVSSVLAYEVFRTLELKEVEIDTPLERTLGHEIAEDVIVVPILRAGLGMIDGFVEFLPEARIGHLGMYRDEETHEPVDYYANIPSGIETAKVIVVDPMLATGGSASGAINHLKALGATDVTLVTLVSAPEGIALVHADHPEVAIVTAVVDRELDSNAYIRPGLGDAGDRIYGTS
ncbi:MAG: uracil phosphoribosyltransferase [Bacteroidetes Order II. Incertae sedis bacterium]|jgi:uracil phosphoribosyltransferase|nr:uracil phosphoribosyltransferase [Bacteroidetes Order II. bacterium]MDG1753483.1 uracil phosphoribosyltransferase [Rhodothermales bacterium]HAY35518.1 uracil phosphoribosyltransferase [Bacteroidota bacterium]MBT4052234.1 uracil phosphoribosyltransferase [Bacteroidetes Order II. bacterium]MBT4603668.1 uracil phosphoribosyltransferase [Bacteroidetes Order II. bacterium]